MSATTTEQEQGSGQLPDVIPAVLIADEVREVLRYTGEGAPHPDVKILLATVLFADEEGVAKLGARRLRKWCARPGHRTASRGYVVGRIGRLIEAGVLAPGSTPTELRSMIGRRAEDGLEALAA